jgi:hypothetical protein
MLRSRWTLQARKTGKSYAVGTEAAPAPPRQRNRGSQRLAYARVRSRRTVSRYHNALCLGMRACVS